MNRMQPCASLAADSAIQIYGGMGLTVVETNEWGGLMLTLVLATVTIIVSLPLGVVFRTGAFS